jgi:hypothetical protein
MSQSFQRRTLLKAALLGSAALPFALRSGEASAAQPLVSADDPVAKSLGYVSDTTKVKAAENPTHKATQRCDNCAQFVGKVGDKQGPCNLFPGKDVHGQGWCKVWVQKPGT